MSTPPVSEGTTPTERLLFQLCRESFLQLWSYPNVFRDQDKRGSGDGKELCDVMVVCGNTVILFSDKCCTFPSTGDLALDWSRWYRRAVLASQEQLKGAERWLRTFPARVFTDRRCTCPLHVPLPPASQMRIYKVAVAIGAAERARKHFGGGSGSLILMQTPPAETLPDSEHEAGIVPFTTPFRSKDGDFFHVVDDVTLPLLLDELDTISDFVAYLEAKERLVKERKAVLVEGEEDLLGLYLGTGAALPDVVASWEGFDAFVVKEGLYAEMRERADYQAYVEENLVSYFWDYLIDNHTDCMFEGTLVEGSAKTVVENEELLRILAQEPRLNRRLLSQQYLDLMHDSPRDETSSRTVRLSNDTMYVLQVNPKPDGDYAQYRRDRQAYLVNYCFLTGWRFRDTKRVVGLVTDGANSMGDGYDIVAFQFDEWTEDLIAEGERLDQSMSKDVVRSATSRELNARFLTPWASAYDEVQPGRLPRNRFKKRKNRRR